MTTDITLPPEQNAKFLAVWNLAQDQKDPSEKEAGERIAWHLFGEMVEDLDPVLRERKKATRERISHLLGLAEAMGLVEK